MKCLVAVKRVIDFNVKVHVKSDGSGVETEHVKMSINPFDEIALEEALRLKEAGLIEEIIAVSIGPAVTQETLRVALARAADKAILFQTETQASNTHPMVEPIHVAWILKTWLLKNPCELVLLGKQAIDDDCNQTGQMLAGLMDWSQGTFASKVQLDPNQKKVTVEREVDGGLQTVELSLPAVITTDLRLNEPRYISLPNVMKAKTKPFTIINLADFAIEENIQSDLNPHLKTLKIEPPLPRHAGVKVKDAKELLDKLMFEAKVL